MDGVRSVPDGDHPAGLFGRPVAAMADAWAERLERRLAGVAGLGGDETEVILRSARGHLLAVGESRLNRLFLLELHAASLGGGLNAPDAEGRWAAFLELAAEPAFRERLDHRYPTLRARLDAAGHNHAQAVATLAERLVTDRAELDALAGRRLGELRALTLGSGDPHRGGHTVSRLGFADGTVMYKPRPMEVDAALDNVLAALLPGADRIRTPTILARDGYGWTAYVEHRHCADDAESAAFYRGLGHWLAVMRLIGGTDLHGGNIVAHGPVPVVVDAETMFSPAPVDEGPRGAGALDAAERIMRRAVTRVGILPMRVGLLSGVDLSTAGRLPDEQPTVRVPAITGAGTDAARLVEREGRLPASGNHPSPAPEPERFWEEIVAGFEELSARLRRTDREGALMPALKPFLGCEIRQVLRSTQVYGDIRHMLWHPAALHDEPAARRHARAALRRHARANPIAPGDDAAIDAEIADLLVGDTPVYTARLTGERLRTAVDDWRTADLALEARLIRYALAGVYADGHGPRAMAAPAPLGGGGVTGEQRGGVLPRDAAARHGRGGTTPIPLRVSSPATPVRPSGADRRRRALAAEAAGALRDTAIRGADGSVTWIGPVLGDAGWAVHGLGGDLHSGQPGTVVGLAAYLREAHEGRAEPVAGLGALLSGALDTLRRLDERPTRGPGALTGRAGRLWTWLTLSSLLGEGVAADALDRAVACAAGLRAPGVRGTHGLNGWAGAVVPLLDLGAATGDAAWPALAADIGRGLAGSLADQSAGERTAGTQGFAYGRAGTAWALRRLADSGAGDTQERAGWRESADTAFLGAAGTAAVHDHPGWCRGGPGIGLAACDLYVRTGDDRHLDVIRRAATGVAARGPGRGRSLCHGAPGAWQLLAAARRADPALPELPAPEAADDALLTALAAPARPGLDAAEATAPGLLNGLAGTVLTLLRMHPEHALGGSPLLLASRP